jgi:hypothetical protein
MKTEDMFHPVITSEMSAAGSHSFPKASTSTNTLSDGPEKRPEWIYELEDDGTVIYSRPRSEGEQIGLEGQNFFDEVAGFEDIARYRKHFQSFVKSNKAIASFIWRRSSAGMSIDTRVLMTRAYQSGGCPRTGVVMMEIRGC